MRITHLHWGFPPIIGGVESHLATMLPVMVKNGQKVSLVTCSAEGTKPNENYEGVEIYRTPLMDLNWLFKRGLEGIGMELKSYLNAVVDKEKPELFHAHNMHYFSKIHLEILSEISKNKGIPVVLTAHNVWDDVLYLDLVKYFDWARIIAVSHYIKSEMLGIGFNDSQITVIHHGIDTKKYRPDVSTVNILKKHPRLKGRRIIFHPARMGLGKGCDVSIKALTLVKDTYPDVILIQAGTKNIIDWGETQQKDIAYFVNLIKLMKLSEYVLIDAFSMREVAELYALAEVCVYPSSASEPFGLTMLESLAAAKPIIVTRMGGMPEIIQDGINGFVIPVRNYEALSMHIMQLLSNKPLAKQLGNTGRQIVKRQFTKEIMTQNTTEIYNSVLGSLK